ncbi:cocaine esterase, partial [Listeria ivanovii FSL F6-596]
TCQKGKVSAEFTPPTTDSEATFSYNPENPVPSNGGGTLHKELHADGPRDQQALELREDILCYTTAPLTEALEVTGSVQVRLWAKTDAPNTDFTAKLVDVFPDGRAFNLADGIIRAAKQYGDRVQNNINEYTIDLWATSNLFRKGHQIRVEISSSNFPRFDPNPNTGESFINSTESQVANQTIYHSPEYPSHILLPIVR